MDVLRSPIRDLPPAPSLPLPAPLASPAGVPATSPHTPMNVVRAVVGGGSGGDASGTSTGSAGTLGAELRGSHNQRQLRALRRSANRHEPHRRSPHRHGRRHRHDRSSEEGGDTSETSDKEPSKGRHLVDAQFGKPHGGGSALPSLRASALFLPPLALPEGSQVFPIVYAWRRSSLRLPTELTPPATDAAASAYPWLQATPEWHNRQRVVCLQASSALLILYRCSAAAAPPAAVTTDAASSVRTVATARSVRVRFGHEEGFRRLKLPEALQLPTSSERLPPSWYMVHVGHTLTRHREISELHLEMDLPPLVDEVLIIRHCPALLRAAILHARATARAGMTHVATAYTSRPSAAPSPGAAPSPAFESWSGCTPPESLLSSPRQTAALAAAAASRRGSDAQPLASPMAGPPPAASPYSAPHPQAPLPPPSSRDLSVTPPANLGTGKLGAAQRVPLSVPLGGENIQEDPTASSYTKLDKAVRELNRTEIPDGSGVGHDAEPASPHARALSLLKAKQRGSNQPTPAQTPTSPSPAAALAAATAAHTAAVAAAAAVPAAAAAGAGAALFAPSWVGSVPLEASPHGGDSPSTWQVASSLPRDHDDSPREDGASPEQPSLLRPLPSAGERFRTRMAMEGSRMDKQGTPPPPSVAPPQLPQSGADAVDKAVDEAEAERRELVEELHRLRREVKARETTGGA